MFSATFVFNLGCGGAVPSNPLGYATAFACCYEISGNILESLF